MNIPATDLMTALRSGHSTSPRLTWYGPDAERVELSGRVLDNWVSARIKDPLVGTSVHDLLTHVVDHANNDDLVARIGSRVPRREAHPHRITPGQIAFHERPVDDRHGQGARTIVWSEIASL